jgi:hypothetical protein
MLPDSVTSIESDALARYDDGRQRANLSIDGGITDISETAFGNYSSEYDCDFDTLLIRGSKISRKLCTAIQKFSPNEVLVTRGSGFAINQSLCDEGIRVTGFADPTPFPTPPATLSPRATLSRSRLASSSRLPPNPSSAPGPLNANDTMKILTIVGIVLGEIALIVVSVGVTCCVMRRRRRDDGDHQLFSGLAN